MMRCKHCGEYLRSTSIYCDKCGRKVEIDLDSTRVFDFDLSQIDLPDQNADDDKGPLIRRSNFLPMFFSISALICVMALCVSVLTYAITYDTRSQRLRRTSNIDAENGLTLDPQQTRPPEDALPVQVTSDTTSTSKETASATQTTTEATTTTTTTTRETTTTTRKTTTTTATSEPETTTTTTADEGFWKKKKSDTSSVTTTTALFPEFDLTSTTTSEVLTSEPEEDGDSVIPDTMNLIDTMYVADDKGELFLRKGPGYGYDFVNFLGISPATEADVYAQEYDDGSGEMWVYVSSDGYSGWTTMSMLSHTKPKISSDRRLTYFSAQTTKKTDMYSGASKFYGKKGTISKGTYVEILEFSDSYDWVYVYVDGKYGWIRAENVEMEGYV